jgi:hypothetical protein
LRGKIARTHRVAYPFFPYELTIVTVYPEDGATDNRES